MNFRLIVLLGALIGSPSVFAHEYKLGPLEIGHPYARPTPPGAKTGAAYLSVTNRGKAADRLVQASSSVAASVDLHSMRMEGNIMRMRPEKAIEVPAGGTVKLEPNGRLHIMLEEIKQPLKKGDRIPLTLRFEKAGEIKVELSVDEPASAASKDAPKEASHQH